MKIAIASGKGGTGKTTVAVSLALALAGVPPGERPEELLFLDCDVEAPNAHLFLHPRISLREPVGILLPEVDSDRCSHCGRCAEVCVYHAIAALGKKVLVFPQLCHGCGSCAYNCPEGAIAEIFHPIGELAWGSVPVGGREVRFGQGTMDIGEPMATPIIRQLKHAAFSEEGNTLAILDAPPGNACPVVETLRGVDVVLLVTEPTPFGLHDLRIAVEVARDELGLPVGVVINRDGVGDAGVEDFCAETGVPVLLRIPLERRIAESYAEGRPLIAALPEYRERFVDLYHAVCRLAESAEGVRR